MAKRALSKNLANCTPEEFLVQTNKIRKSAERWLKATDILSIRKNVPKLDIPDDADSDEIDRIMDEHREKVKEQARKNLSDILDSVLEDHPKETLELLAYLCFVEPSKVNDYKITDYIANAVEIIEDEDVLSFFSSLMRLEQRGILIA